jgi:hypothetical protein
MRQKERRPGARNTEPPKDSPKPRRLIKNVRILQRKSSSRLSQKGRQA